MNPIAEFLFVLTLGLTTSGIVANLYRLAGLANETSLGGPLSVVVLIFTGPSELFESAIEGRIAQKWSPASFWLAIAMASYWGLVLGVIVLQMTMLV